MGRNYALNTKQITEAIKLYEAHKSMADIAHIFGVSNTAISNALKLHGIAIRPRSSRVQWTLERMKLNCMIDRSECWNWSGCVQANGYGRVRFKGKTVYAHRLAFFFFHGRWPKFLGCHTCDNRKCCNPEHVHDADHQWNSSDASQKGRTSSGVKHALTVLKHARKIGNAKLTEADAQKIRELLSSGESVGKVASDFGVSKSNVWLIRKGKAWRQYGTALEV